MILSQNNSALLIVDIQTKLLNAVFNKDIVEKNSKILTKAAQILNLPIFITEQYPQGLGETIEGLKDQSSQVFIKTDFNAINDKILLENLNKTGKKDIIVFGIETHICVYQTAMALIDKGFNVTIAIDACGSRAKSEYDLALNVLKNNGAQIKSTEMILFELIKSSKHPNFKEIQSLIK